jgi:hypothetical protein
MSNVCNVVKENLGLSTCNKLPALIRSIITTPDDFVLTQEQAAVSSNWQDALITNISDRIYLWPNFVGFEDVSEKEVYEDTPLAYLAVRDGKYRFRFDMKESLCFHKAMYSHRANSGRAFLFDVENQLIGTLDSDGNVQGFSIQLLNTEKMKFSDGKVSTKSSILLALQNNLELDQAGVLMDASFVNSLKRLTDVTITIVSAIATKIICTVAVTCDGTPVNGLVKADFSLTKASDGTAQTISSVTEDDGEYTLNGSGLVNGFLTLVAPSVLSIEAYEADTATVTVAS